MNIDIQTEHVMMRPEWHRTIEAWLERCASRHPEVAGIDLTLRRDECLHSGGEVEVAATARGHTLRAARRAEVMDVALEDTLDALEQALRAPEAAGRRAS